MARILHFGGNRVLVKTRSMLFERAGYSSCTCMNVSETLTALVSESPDVLVIGSAVSRSDRLKAAAAASKSGVLVLSMHRGMRGQNENAVVDPLSGPNDLLLALGQLLMRHHGHPEIRSKCFLYVDRDRRYVHASDAACALVGYERADLLGMRIDDLTYPGSAKPELMFVRYLRDGSQVGQYVLRHKAGQPVRVRYRARVLPDGCLVSELRKLPARLPARRSVSKLLAQYLG